MPRTNVRGIAIETSTNARSAVLDLDLNIYAGGQLDALQRVDRLREFSIAPNPTQGNLKINFTPENEGKLDLMLIDQTGKQIYVEQFNSEKTNYVGISTVPIISFTATGIP